MKLKQVAKGVYKASINAPKSMKADMKYAVGMGKKGYEMMKEKNESRKMTKQLESLSVVSKNKKK